jgi:hypothetical protein
MTMMSKQVEFQRGVHGGCILMGWSVPRILAPKDVLGTTMSLISSAHLNFRAHCELHHLSLSAFAKTLIHRHYSHFVPPLPSSLASVYFPSKSGLTNSTNNLQANGGANMPIHNTATVTPRAASALPPLLASIAKIGNKHASPMPNKRYVGRRLSIPFRVLVAPARRAEVKPPTTMPPKRRAKRTEEGLM